MAQHFRHEVAMSTNYSARGQLVMLAAICLVPAGCLPSMQPAADGTTTAETSTAAPSPAAAPAATPTTGTGVPTTDVDVSLLPPVERPVSPELQPEKDAMLALMKRGLVKQYFVPPIRSPGIFHTETHLITDKDMELIGVFASLDQLDLENSQVSDAGMVHLADKKKLKRLFLSGTQITDAGLAQLREVSDIEELVLDGVPITDASLEVIAGFQQLKRLDLSRTKVTDAGLGRLSGLKNLKDLSLYGASGISGRGVARLHEALPELKIHGGPDLDGQ
jgi:hypothetical protein